MSSLARQVELLAGCNVAGRLRHIRSLNLNSQASLYEIDKLLSFIDPPEEDITPNGYDRDWLTPINRALRDRGHANRQITDISDKLWDSYLGPMLDFIALEGLLEFQQRKD